MSLPKKPFNPLTDAKKEVPLLPLSRITLTEGVCPFRHAYSPQLRVITETPGPSMTKQAFKEECDINVIMSRYMQTGVIDFVTKHSPRYGDATGMDYMEAMLTVTQANAMFADLPARIREEFNNNPAEFLDFVHDEENRDAMIDMGLMKPGVEKSAAPSIPAAKAAPEASNTPQDAPTGGKGEKPAKA